MGGLLTATADSGGGALPTLEEAWAALARPNPGVPLQSLPDATPKPRNPETPKPRSVLALDVHECTMTDHMVITW